MPVPRLIVIKGADEGKQFELTQDVLGAGRDATNAIRLHDTEISRRHAEFRLVNGAYRLADVGSANGTFVNNQPVKDVELRPGDHIRIGQSMLVYSAGAAAPASSGDLAGRISLIGRKDLDEAMESAIVKTMAEAEGSRILSQPNQANTPWLKNALANLSVMYETAQAVSHILDLDQLLERIMDLIFRSLGADRGCVMLHSPATGQFEPKAVRWRTPGHGDEPIALSRTIMDYVLREKQGVLVSDAAQDARFNTGQSIVRLGIREAVCVPMKGRH
jgi:predicted component of type VI protein secretion system